MYTLQFTIVLSLCKLDTLMKSIPLFSFISSMIRPHHPFLLLWTACLFCSFAAKDELVEVDEEPHPDPNVENYSGMIYIGRLDDDGKRVGFDADNGMLNVSIIKSSVLPMPFIYPCVITQ